MKTKTAYYEGIKVKLLGTKTAAWERDLIDIRFPNGVIYACPPEKLTIKKP